MRKLRSGLILFALLAFSLQVAAAPLGLACTHPVPEAAAVQMQDDLRAHHATHDPTNTDSAGLNCAMGCNCGGGCIHACQLSLVQPVLTAMAVTPQTPLLLNRPDSTHHAYTHPLLRPPAIL